MTGFVRALEQIRWLLDDVGAVVNGRWWRWYTCWFSSGIGVVVAYRLCRAGHLALGPVWAALRIVAAPVALALRPWWGRCEVHYGAEIGPGLHILHPGLGVVVSKHAVLGSRVTLTGGNCIGGRRRLARGDLVIGDQVILGANAVVLGPVRVGNRVCIGAGAVVVSDIPDDSSVVGVPAKAVGLADGPDDAAVAP
jgi:serine acetyltransferase